MVSYFILIIGGSVYLVIILLTAFSAINSPIIKMEYITIESTGFNYLSVLYTLNNYSINNKFRFEIHSYI